MHHICAWCASTARGGWGRRFSSAVVPAATSPTVSSPNVIPGEGRHEWCAACRYPEVVGRWHHLTWGKRALAYLRAEEFAFIKGAQPREGRSGVRDGDSSSSQRRPQSSGALGPHRRAVPGACGLSVSPARDAAGARGRASGRASRCNSAGRKPRRGRPAEAGRPTGVALPQAGRRRRGSRGTGGRRCDHRAP